MGKRAAGILWERFQKRNLESAGKAVPSQQIGLPLAGKTRLRFDIGQRAVESGERSRYQA